MTAPVTIAPGDILDLNAVMGVMEDSFDPAYGEAWTGPQIAGLIPMPGVWLSLARQGDDVIGFALSRQVVQEAELMLLAVKTSAQRRGVGYLLLQNFVELAERRGVSKLYLEVRDGNEAISLYNSFDFTEVGRRPKYYTGKDGQVYDAVTLARKVGL